jgi:hypothetical protein
MSTLTIPNGRRPTRTTRAHRGKACIASVLIVTSDLPDLAKLVAGRPGVAVVHVSKLGQPSGN